MTSDTGSFVGEKVIKIHWVFLAEAFIYLLILYGTNTFVFTDEVLLNMLTDLPSIEINQYLAGISVSRLLSYLLSPVLFGIKILIICCVLYTGLILKERYVSYKKVFSLLLVAEMVFIASAVFRFARLLNADSFDSISVTISRSSVSMARFLDANAAALYVNAATTANIYELSYLLLLSRLLSRELAVSYWVGLKFVLGSYGLLLLCWVFLVSLLQQTV